eukprot:7477321-Prorocentrum_lima.AAC.1
MTSSLVGSEMCIRDRPRTVLTVVKDTRETAASRDDILKKVMMEELSEPCLLYTSDAADDM